MARKKVLEDEITKVYKFKAIYKTFYCYSLGILFKDGYYETTDKDLADKLKKVNGVVEV